MLKAMCWVVGILGTSGLVWADGCMTPRRVGEARQIVRSPRQEAAC